MHQARKGKQWHFGIKANIGVDAQGLVYTVVSTSANVNDVMQAGSLLHGQEKIAFGDVRYQDVHKRSEAAGAVWHVALRSGLRRKLNPLIELDLIAGRLEKAKASVRAKVEHTFRVVKQQFNHAKVRYLGLTKNTAWRTMLFALSYLWMARRQDLGSRG
jgi:IS5 family transposase